MFDFSSLEIRDVLISFSIVVAIVTWFVSQNRDRKARIAAHTADLLAHTKTDERISAANHRRSSLSA